MLGFERKIARRQGEQEAVRKNGRRRKKEPGGGYLTPLRQDSRPITGKSEISATRPPFARRENGKLSCRLDSRSSMFASSLCLCTVSKLSWTCADTRQTLTACVILTRQDMEDS